MTTLAALTVGAFGTTTLAAPAAPVEAPSVGAAFANLSVGSQGSDVKAMQQALMDAGISLRGGADGVFGPVTRQAVRDFQEARGLAVSGDVDDATSAALVGNAASSGTGAGAGLSIGAEGSEVEALQERLTASGVYLPGGADGVFGPATKLAVTQFQGWNGLERTGTVNNATAKSLGAASNAGAESAPAPSPESATAPPASSNSHVGLARGARSDLVKQLQTALQGTGLVLRGGADGIFGPATEAALKAFQSVNEFSQTGVVSERDAEILELGSSEAPAPAASSPPESSSNSYVGLSVGANGALVKEVQQALQNTGLALRGGVDGVFGPATKSTLIAFQSVNGISQNGVVTQKGVDLLGLGSGSVGIVNPNTGGGSVELDRFPTQGNCFFGDTWHAARGGGRKHVGVDIIADKGNLLYAVVDGEISKQYWDQPGALAGNGLRVAQPNGTYFTYLHMSGFAPGIELGTKVEAGDVIGFVGTTGSSATPHLHLEIHPNGGDAVNPYPYVKAIDDCSNTKAQYQSSFT